MNGAPGDAVFTLLPQTEEEAPLFMVRSLQCVGRAS